MNKSDYFRDVETMVCRTNTWACTVARWACYLAWLYVFVSIVESMGGLIGGIVVVVLCLLMFKMPVVLVVEPLDSKSLRDFEDQKGADSQSIL